MPNEVTYRIKFPIMEFEAIHAKQAMIDACNYFLNHSELIEWSEIIKDE